MQGCYYCQLKAMLAADIWRQRAGSVCIILSLSSNGAASALQHMRTCLSTAS